MAKSTIGDNWVGAQLQEFREIVLRFLELGDISKKELAESAGVSYATVQNFLKGDTPYVRYSTVAKIMRAVAHELYASEKPPKSPPSKKRAGRMA
jgi:predicted transcriptional regulator